MSICNMYTLYVHVHEGSSAAVTYAFQNYTLIHKVHDISRTNPHKARSALAAAATAQNQRTAMHGTLL